MIMNIKKKIIIAIICVSLFAPIIHVLGLFLDLPCAYAASTAGVSFEYKKGYSVNGSHQGIYHYIDKSKPKVTLTSLTGASGKNKVKVHLYSGGKYYGTVSFAQRGTQQFSTKVPKGRYYLRISGGCGNNKGWIKGAGKINPVYR